MWQASYVIFISSAVFLDVFYRYSDIVPSGIFYIEVSFSLVYFLLLTLRRLASIENVGLLSPNGMHWEPSNKVKIISIK